VNHCLRQISRETTGAIKSFSRKEGVSAFGTLLAAYSALLGQLHTLPEVVINVPIAGQPDAEMEDCVGPLANVVPVRCKTDRGRAFSDLVHEIHGLILDGREHSQVGISDILQPEMSLATTASFTHVQKYPPGKVAFGSCDMDYQLAARTFDEPDIGVCVLESQHALTFHMHANARDYDQPSIAELLRLLESFLREACETPATSVATLMERARKSVAAAGPQPFNQASHSNEMSLAGFFGIGVRAVVSTAARNTNGSEDYVCEKPIVVTLQPGDPRKPPLLCIFGIQLYADLAVSIVDGTPVVGIHVPIISRPWRGRRPSLEEITDIYLGVVNEVCPSGPCNLAGLCFGGIVAYELARKLREQGRAVPAVFLFDAYLPNGRHVDYKLRASNIASSVLRRPVQTLGGALLKASARRAPLLLKSPVGQKTLERWVAKITGEDPTVPIDFPVLGEEAKSEVARLDAEKTFLDSTLVVFRASQADTPVWQNNDQDMGWGGRARSVICFDVASDHLGIVRRPHAERVSSEIMRQISAT
jgi:thioesterase domain-containing protein